MILWSFFVVNCMAIAFGQSSIEEDSDSGRYVIEGRVFPLSDYQTSQSNWQANTRIHLNGGEYLGFVKKDGSFVVSNLPTGSYVVEVLNPEYTFEPVRVEINSKGKYRSRKVNHIQTSLVIQVPYPLRMKALARTRYFQMREQWRITDLVMNPMVLMMVLPLVLVMILPKLMNDPETKKEMEQIQSFTKFELPEVSEVVSNYLSGGSGSGAGASQNGNSQSVGAGGKKALKAKKRQ